MADLSPESKEKPMESLQVAMAKARLSPKPQPPSHPLSPPPASPQPESGVAATGASLEPPRAELRQIKDKLDALERLFLQLSQSLAAAATLRQDERTRAPSILDIKHAICRRYGVTMGEIDSPQHDARLVRPRHIAMYLAHRLTLKSLPEIGRGFGGRDHTTILNAKKKIANLRAEDRDFAEELAELERSLAGPPK
jgi:hypothetical protein